MFEVNKYTFFNVISSLTWLCSWISDRFSDVTASTVLLGVISFQNLPLNQTEAINLTNFLELFLNN